VGKSDPDHLRAGIYETGLPLSLRMLGDIDNVQVVQALARLGPPTVVQRFGSVT